MTLGKEYSPAPESVVINNMVMSNSRTITIKNPSRKLEEKIREAGVQKYLWLKELCSEETKPNKVIYV